jgi:small subunit ribosomal protein S20
MAQHKSAVKRNRQSEKRRLRNKSRISRLKTMVKKVRSAKTSEEAEPILKEATALLDRYSAKGFIHKNNAANKKRSLTRYANSLKAPAQQAKES